MTAGKTTKVNLILLFLYLAIAPLLSQDDPILFDQIISNSSGNSLSQNSVFAIAQDKYGLMWFGTQVGLDRYDGKRFETYRYDSSRDSTITKGHVTALCVKDDYLWVGTKEGLSRIQYNDKEKGFVIERLFDTIEVDKIVKSNLPGIIYFLSDNVLYKYSRTKKIEKLYEFSKETIVTDIIYYPLDNKVLVSTNKGIYYYGENIPLSSNLIDISFFRGRQISALGFDQNAKELIVAYGDNSNKIVFYDLKGDSTTRWNPPYLKKSKKLKINNLLLDAKNQLWIGTEHSGIYHFHKSESKSIIHLPRQPKQPFSLNSNLTLSLHESRDGVVWIGSNGGGINKWSNKKQVFHHIYRPVDDYKKEVLSNDVWAIYRNGSKLYLGTEGNGIIVYNVPKNSRNERHQLENWIRHLNDSILYNTVTCFEKISQRDSLLIGTEIGIYKVNVKDSLFSEKNRINLDSSFSRITCLRATSQNEYLVGSIGGGLMLLDNKLKEKKLFSEIDKVNVIVESNSPLEYLVGTGNNLLRFSIVSRILDTLPIPGWTDKLNISSLAVDSNMVYIGTFGDGLIVYDLEKNTLLQRYHQKNKLPDNVIYGVLVDQNGIAWISSNSGVSSVDIKNDIVIVNNYAEDDGLQHGEFNSGAYYRYVESKSGKEILYFGGLNGLNYFSPKALSYQDIPYQFSYSYVITDASGFKSSLVFDKKIEELKIPHEGRAAIINFSVLDYHDPDNNCSFYELYNESTGLVSELEPAINNEIKLAGNHVFNQHKLETGINVLKLNHRTSYGKWNNQSQVKLTLDVEKSLQEIRAEKLRRAVTGLIIVAILLGIVAMAAFRFFRKSENSQRLLKKSNAETKLKNSELTLVNKELSELSTHLQKKNDSLSSLQSIINEITRKDTTKDIFNLATKHLINSDYFDFDYAIIYIIDKNKSKILQQFCKGKNPAISPPPCQWRIPELEDALIPDDVLAVVFNNQGIQVKVKADEIEVPEKYKGIPIELDKKIYTKNNHDQIHRVFLPIVKRSEKIKGKQEDDFSFGVLEVGNHIDSKKAIDETLLINLKLYVDNCAQSYHRAYYKENEERNIEIIQKHFVEEDHKIYLEKILKDVVKAYDCAKGDIALASYSQNGKTWIPKEEESVLVGVKFPELDAVRRKGLNGKGVADKCGIYRHAFESGNYYYSGNVNVDPYYLAGLKDINSQLSVPLISYGKCIGTLNLYSEEKDFFDEFKAQNIQYLAELFTDIYLRKRANNIIKELLLPINYLTKDEIHLKIQLLLKEYFLTDDAYIFETKENGQLHGLLFENLKPDKSQLIQKEKLNPTKLKALLSDNGVDAIESLIIAPLKPEKGRGGQIVVASKRKIIKLFPEDEIFLRNVVNKLAFSTQVSGLLGFYRHFLGSLAEGTPDKTYKKITENAKDFFKADLVVLVRFVQGKQSKFRRIISTGKTRFSLQGVEEDGHSNNRNVADIVAEMGEIYIENKMQYQTHFNPIERNWQSDVWPQDFWEREEIKSFAAVRLGPEDNPSGALFLNYRMEYKGFDAAFRNLLDLYSRIASQAIVNATVMEENKAFQEKNIRLTKPFVESSIISGLAHNTGNLVGSIIRRFNNFRQKLEKIKDDKVETELVKQQMDKIEAPLKSLNTDYLKLREFRKSDEKVFFEDVEIKVIVDEVINLVKSKAEKKKIKLELGLHANPKINCDKNYLEHAIMNLLLNSIDEIKPSSGGKIHIQTELDYRKKNLIIKIIDNGPGIKKENFSKIFQPYFTTKKDIGTGIGLPITKYIIEKVHKGDLDFHSEVRKGATFIATLPIANK